MSPSPRSKAQRIADSRALLSSEVDAWVATAHSDGGPPALVPLSYWWDGAELLIATARHSPAATNMRASGRARLALGRLRDVVMIDATATEYEIDAIPDTRWSRYVAQVGWDPRREGPTYGAFVLRPVTVQVWRESNELARRTLMRQGVWLDEAAESNDTRKVVQGPK